jgi:hypothetical protein
VTQREKGKERKRKEEEKLQRKYEEHLRKEATLPQKALAKRERENER